jgi:serralysin
MATLTYGDGGIKYDTAMTKVGTYTSVTSSQVVITTTDGWQLVGTGSFNITEDDATGILNGYAFYQPGGATYVSITNMNYSVSTYLAYSDAGDATGLYRDMMRGNDGIVGGNGNDRFLSSAGADSYNGGAGVDTVVYGATRASHTVTKSAISGTVTVAKPGTTSTDSHVNVERLVFSDNKGVAFDIDGLAGQAYRLYQAAFNRQPDSAGLGWQLSSMDKGMSVLQVASNFIASTEFQTLYGTNLTDNQLITQMYRNVLDREPDSAGLAHWLNVLGTGQLSRSDVLYYFSESAENQAQVIGSIQGGIEYTYYA